jgi:hypothetical protein
MTHLLIAGPLALDDHPQQAGLLGGVGGYAAMAAAPLARTQLWCRAGADINPQVRAILDRRGIILDGVSWSGTTPRGTAAGFVPGGPLLPPDLEPTTADGVGAVLLIGLDPLEWDRATRVIAAFAGAATRPVISSPRPADLADAAFCDRVCAGADVLVLSVAQALRVSGKDAPLAAAESFISRGAKAVALTAGQLGGLLVYRQKSTTWPVAPVATVDKLGVSAAFPGALAAWIAGTGAADFSTVKRGCAMASAVGSICAQGIGPRKLLTADRNEYLERFNRLRRAHKF